MTDIMIKDSGLCVADGDFVAISALEELKQQIMIAMKTFQSDWALNRLKGINYSYGIRNTAFLEMDVRQQLLGVRNVQSVDKLELNFDKETLAITISAIIKTMYGEVYLNETINAQ